MDAGGSRGLREFADAALPELGPGPPGQVSTTQDVRAIASKRVNVFRARRVNGASPPARDTIRQ